MAGKEITTLQKKKGLIIQKLFNVIIRNLVHSQRLHYWLIVERFLVCHPKNGGILGQKVAVEKHRFSTSK